MNYKKLIPVIIIAIVLIIIASVVGSAVTTYNRTVDRRESVDTYEAEVKSRLQQRHDKMEQIISAVEGLEDHAEDLMTLITEARAAYAGASTVEQFAEADAMEANALSRLLVIVEDNPEGINASSAYYSYINEASAMENVLAVARRDYNEAVRDYNVSVKKFPTALYIGMFGFEEELPYWKTDEGSEEVPIVDFTD